MLPWKEGPAKRGERGRITNVHHVSTGDGRFLSYIYFFGFCFFLFSDQLNWNGGQRETGKSRSEGLCKQLNTHTHTHADSRITNDTKISLGGVFVRVCIVKRGLGEMIWSRRCVKKKTEWQAIVSPHRVKRSAESPKKWPFNITRTPPVLHPLHPVCPPYSPSFKHVCAYLCVIRAVHPLVEGKRHSTLPT